jgi:undecaprenyl-diphosphatase
LSNYGFDFFMPLITNENNWIIPILLLVIYLGLIGGKRGQIALVLMILAIGITDSFSSYVLKPYFARIRPSYTLIDSINLLVSKGGKWSMPSNHAGNIYAFAVIISYFYKKWKFPIYFLAGIVALSRVYVGVHYPADVLVGGLLGYLVSWTILTLWVILKMRELKRGKMWVWYEKEYPNNIC